MKKGNTLRLLSFFLFVSWSTALGNVIHVPAEQPTIQAGIDAAASGDTVLVADGTYMGAGNTDVDFNGKSIVLKSENGPYATIIDCQSNSRAFILQTGEDGTTVIEGFTVRNGRSVSSCYPGGAIYINRALTNIRNCMFHDNTTESYGYAQGGAVFCQDGSLTIEGCIFRKNNAFGMTLMDGALGGAVYAGNCQLTIQGCTFDDNYAGLLSSYGGALYAVSSTILMETCRFLDNDGIDGGALRMASSNGSINQCWFEGNHGRGAINVVGASFVELTGCAFIRNYGYSGEGGIFHGGGSVSIITNATFFGNSGGAAGCLAVSNGCTTTVANSIFSFSGEGEVVTCGDNTAVALSCCDVYGNTSGDWTGCIAGQQGIKGNFSLDPLFCDTVEGSFYVDRTSPCAPWNSPCSLLVGAFDAGCPCCVGYR
ncbi:MAG: right-handed parallel beta-helix repeat-containing protein, partial [Candidatus Zixiibacteriota bacterium]